MDYPPYTEVLDLGELVSSHEVCRDTDWSYIALVATFTSQRRSMFGYVFFDDGRWEALLPRDPGRSVMKAFRRLHEHMEAINGGAWQQCLLEISRIDFTVSVDFEYDDPDRWSVTPDKLQEMLGEYVS
jgi:hypothetical protein